MTLAAPSTQELSRLYYELGKIGARAVGAKKSWRYFPKNKESLFSLAADWSRFDPRLLQILVNYALTHWQDLKPQDLRLAMKNMATPQCIGVIASFVLQTKTNDVEFELFWNYVTHGLESVPMQFYYIALYAPGGILAETTATESLKEFKTWGFLGREGVILDSPTRKKIGSWDFSSRLNILKRILSKKNRIQLADYLNELHYSLSRQQALLDFKSLKLKQQGHGRGAYWITNKG